MVRKKETLEDRLRNMTEALNTLCELVEPPPPEDDYAREWYPADPIADELGRKVGRALEDAIHQGCLDRLMTDEAIKALKAMPGSHLHIGFGPGSTALILAVLARAEHNERVRWTAEHGIGSR